MILEPNLSAAEIDDIIEHRDYRHPSELTDILQIAIHRAADEMRGDSSDMPEDLAEEVAELVKQHPNITPLHGLRACELLIERTLWARRKLVDHARHRGASWTDVGDALGITRQSAWQRYRADDFTGPASELDETSTGADLMEGNVIPLRQGHQPEVNGHA